MAQRSSTKKKTAAKAPATELQSAKVKSTIVAKKSVIASATSKSSTAKKTVAKKGGPEKMVQKAASDKIAPDVATEKVMKSTATGKFSQQVPSLAEQLQLQLSHKKHMSEETTALIDKGHAIGDVTKPMHAIKEDKRTVARHEHIHQFASRTPEQH